MVNGLYEDELAELRFGEPNPKRIAGLIDALLRKNDNLFQKISHRYSRYWSDGPTHDKGEAIQIVRQIAWDVLTEISNGSDLKGLAWEAVVNVRSRTAIRDYVTSSSSTGIPGSGSIIRRQQAIARHADYLMETTGRQVVGQELMDSYNKSVEHVPNASKRGLFATHTDMSPAAAVSIVVAFEDQTEEASERVEMLDVIRSVIDICAKGEDPNLVRVAKLWLGWYPDGEVLTYSAIAVSCKLSPAKVSHLVDETREIFQLQLASD